MKIGKLSAAALLPLIMACTGNLGQETIDITSELTVSVTLEGMQENGTKSSFAWSDTYVRDYEIFLVNADTGTVEDCVFQTGSSAVTMTAVAGQPYVLYALVNHGSKLSARNTAELDDLALDISYDEISSYGIPMSGTYAHVMTTGTNTIRIPVTRLLARIDFKVDPSCLVHADEGCGFSITNVAVCNAMTSYSPFIDENKQTKSTGIDYGFDEASSADLETVNSGGKISLYLFENMQGDLLSGNDDPWSKVPSNISNSERCSYLEVKAFYSAQGLSSDNITYRMFLGGDSTSNFDIKRNTIYTITLIPTEDEIDGSRGSWKIVSRDWDDMRSMIFNPEDITVPSLGSASAVVSMDPEPFDVTISHTDWLDAAGCTWSYDQGTLTVTNVTGITQGITGYVTATSWDEAWDADLLVYVAPMKTPKSLAISPSPVTVKVGGTQTLTATATYSDGSTALVKATFASSNTSIASVTGVRLKGVAAGTTTVTASYTENGKSVSASPVVVTVTQNASLQASESTLDTWGGNSYALTFTYTNTSGTSTTVTPTLTSLTYTGGAPSGLITYSGGTITATDWWGKSGTWVTASPSYVATFAYSGVTTTVTGTMHGFTGFEYATVYDGYFTRMTSSLSVSAATLTGSEERDLTSSAKASSYGTSSSDFSGSYLKTGEYTGVITVTDPSNGKTRTAYTTFYVLTNVKSVCATLKTGDYSCYNGSANNNILISAGDEGTMYDLSVSTNGHDETSFYIWFANFQYTDVWGVNHSVESLTSPDYGSIPPTSKQTWGVMPGDNDYINYSINGFTFYFHLIGY